MVRTISPTSQIGAPATSTPPMRCFFAATQTRAVHNDWPIPLNARGLPLLLTHIGFEGKHDDGLTR